MSGVKEACERLLDQARGASGFILLSTEEGYPAEFVLVRRDDLQALLATWGEKRA